MMKFYVKDSSESIFASNKYGFCFGNGALSTNSDPMNKLNGSECWTHDSDDSYGIWTDYKGNSLLTGDGGKYNDKCFTCVEIECYKVR